jgi:hypothetical protein
MMKQTPETPKPKTISGLKTTARDTGGYAITLPTSRNVSIPDGFYAASPEPARPYSSVSHRTIANHTFGVTSPESSALAAGIPISRDDYPITSPLSIMSRSHPLGLTNPSNSATRRAPTMNFFSPYESALPRPSTRISGATWVSINEPSVDATTAFEDTAPPSKRQRLDSYDDDGYQKT